MKDVPKARGRGRETPNASKRSVEDEVGFALTWLKRHSTRATLEGMARYAIPSHYAYGVAMKDIKALSTMLGRNQPLAVALWATGVYKARMLASFVGDPERLTAPQMERWCKDFDNWAICDAMSFNLLTARRTLDHGHPVEPQTKRVRETTAFALPWSLTVHDKSAATNCGPRPIEREAGDESHFVKKATNMPRAIGKRNPRSIPRP